MALGLNELSAKRGFCCCRLKRRRIGEDLQIGGGKLIKMGSAELTRLWNLNPDNMDACRSEQRSVTSKYVA